ncbi:sigma-70 family RNA polymerase sigma factor [Vibrio coralliilyticus]|uniref:sigma-70 family RNA polymerase sigma factor n=1 Tax=Vibrio coralliilyticus TaxID=190893 RepID=UPI002FD05C16
MKIDTEYIWLKYQAKIRRRLYRYAGCTDDLEDIIQEIMLKIHIGVNGVRDKRKLESWVLKVTKNCAIDFYKKRQYQSLASGNEIEMNIDDYDFYKEMSSCLPFLIGRLPYELSELILNVDILCYSQKEHSDLLGVNYSTLKSQVRKGREMLYRMILECCYLLRNEDGYIIGHERKEKQCCNLGCY